MKRSLEAADLVSRTTEFICSEFWCCPWWLCPWPPFPF